MDIRLKELKYIIMCSYNDGDLTDVGLGNISEYLDYVKQRFDKLVIDVNKNKEDQQKEIESLKKDLETGIKIINREIEKKDYKYATT